MNDYLKITCANKTQLGVRQKKKRNKKITRIYYIRHDFVNSLIEETDGRVPWE